MQIQRLGLLAGAHPHQQKRRAPGLLSKLTSHLRLYADSVNTSVILFHPTLLRGSTVAQITDKGNLLVYESLINIFAAAAASGPYDS